MTNIKNITNIKNEIIENKQYLYNVIDTVKYIKSNNN